MQTHQPTTPAAGPPPDTHGLRARRRVFTLFILLAIGYITAANALAPATSPNSQSGLPALNTTDLAAAPPISSPTLFSLALLALIPAAIRRSGPTANCSLAIAFTLLSAAWFTARVHERPADSLLNISLPPPPPPFINQDYPDAQQINPDLVPRLIDVEGIVIEPPVVDPPRRGAMANFQPFIRLRGQSAPFTLAVFTIHTPDGPQHATGDLRVIAPADLHINNAPLAVGQTLRVQGRWTPPRKPTNPGQTDWTMVAAQHHNVGSLLAPDSSAYARTNAIPPPLLAARTTAARAITNLRHGATQTLDALLHPPELPDTRRTDQPLDAARPLLAALLLGQRDPTTDSLANAFARIGLAHVLAISGFHLVLLAGLAAYAMRLVKDWGWVEPAVIATLVILYMLLVPARAPIMRAGLLVLALIAADAAGRRYDRLTILGWVAIALLIWRPMDLFSIGYQLSVLITAVLIGLAPPLVRRITTPILRGTINKPTTFQRAARWVAAVFAVQVLAWAVATPIIAHHTGIISPIAPIATLLLLPVVIAALALGQVSLIIAAIAPSLAPHIGIVLTAIAQTLADLVYFADRIPGSSFRIGPISMPWAIAATAAIIAAFHAATRRQLLKPQDPQPNPTADNTQQPTTTSSPNRAALEHHRSRIHHYTIHQPRRTAAIALAFLALWFITESTLRWRTPIGVAARIDMLDVGDGSCFLIRSGRHAILWDAGGSRPAIGVRELPSAVRSLGVRTVPTVLITHPDLDHFLVLLDLVEPLGIRTVLVTPQFIEQANQRGNRAPAFLINQLSARSVAIKTIAAGDTIPIGPNNLDILWPPPDQPFERDNDASLVARLTVNTNAGPRSILLTGDIEDLAINQLIAQEPQRFLHNNHIVEIPHHGSARKPAMLAVLSINPDIALQSTSSSRLDDPRWEPVRRGRTWLVTAKHGAAFAEIQTSGKLRAGTTAAKP